MESDITVWEYYSKQKDGSFAWEHNHIEDEYNESQTHPRAKFLSQKQHFSNGGWRKFKAQLLNGVVVLD